MVGFWGAPWYAWQFLHHRGLVTASADCTARVYNVRIRPNRWLGGIFSKWLVGLVTVDLSPKNSKIPYQVPRIIGEWTTLFLRTYLD